MIYNNVKERDNMKIYRELEASGEIRLGNKIYRDMEIKEIIDAFFKNLEIIERD